MQVKATAPRCSMRVTTVLHYPSLLPQTNVLIRPPLSRGVIRGPGQQKVLDIAPTRLASNGEQDSEDALAALRSEPWRPTESNLAHTHDIR
jgi:hypothetical protein